MPRGKRSLTSDLGKRSLGLATLFREKKTRRKRTIAKPTRKKLRKVFFLANRLRTKKGLGRSAALKAAFAKVGRKGYKNVSGRRKKRRAPPAAVQGSPLPKKKRAAKRTYRTYLHRRLKKLEPRFGDGEPQAGFDKPSKEYTGWKPYEG